MAYESPISTYTTTIATNIGEGFDKLVVTEIAKVGVAVDKDELVKALEYDRDQYEKGYLDGRRYKPPIITRADQVRAMSDDEMAEFFYHTWSNAPFCRADDCPDDNTCVPCWLDWLLQEVDDDKSGQDQRADG